MREEEKEWGRRWRIWGGGRRRSGEGMVRRKVARIEDQKVNQRLLLESNLMRPTSRRRSTKPLTLR